MSTPITLLQSQKLMESTPSNTDQLLVLGSNVTLGSVIVVAVGSWDNAVSNLLITDTLGNVYVPDTNSQITYAANPSIGFFYGKVTSAGANTVHVNKSGAGCAVGAIAYEFANVDVAVLDAVSKHTTGTASTASLTSNNSVYTNDLIINLLATSTSSRVVATPTGAFGLQDSLDVYFQMLTSTLATTTPAAQTASWALTGAYAGSDNWNSSVMTLRGYTTAPTIVSLSSSAPAYQSTLVLTGMNFGATAGTVSLGGVAQTVTAWSDTSISITVGRGTNKYGVSADLIATTSAAVVSNAFTIAAGLMPQTGWSFVDLLTLETTSNYRITATTDIVSGDQLAYDNFGNLVAIFSDATFAADPLVTQFAVEAWTPSVWGSSALQIIAGTQPNLIGVAGTTAVQGLSITSSNAPPLVGVSATGGVHAVVNVTLVQLTGVGAAGSVSTFAVTLTSTIQLVGTQGVGAAGIITVTLPVPCLANAADKLVYTMTVSDAPLHNANIDDGAVHKILTGEIS